MSAFHGGNIIEKVAEEGKFEIKRVWVSTVEGVT